MEVLCDIIQSNFDCSGIITSEEKYKNLQLTEKSENILKAYVIADVLDFEKVQSFFKTRRQDLIERKIFNEDIGSWNIQINKMPDTDWSKKWKEHWKPFKISDKIVICPSWEKYIPNDNETVVNIDPGNAFGTGVHATTQLCVRAAEKYMNEGSKTADIGTGSGILSICAAKLGAEEIDAADTDDAAVKTAEINAQINNISNINFYTASSNVLPDKTYDFVFANILHNVLADIMPDLKRIMKKGAKIVLSGIIEGKEKIVTDAAKRNNLKIIEEMRLKEWAAYVCERED